MAVGKLLWLCEFVRAYLACANCKTPNNISDTVCELISMGPFFYV